METLHYLNFILETYKVGECHSILFKMKGGLMNISKVNNGKYKDYLKIEAVSKSDQKYLSKWSGCKCAENAIICILYIPPIKIRIQNLKRKGII